MSATSLPSPYPLPGEVIDGKYRIERVLGEGGMGCVARATHLILRSAVALKFMNPQFTSFPGAVDRFINEGIASKRIRSAHVVPVDDVGKLASGAPYLVMPCLEGMDLADLLARDGTPGLPTARSVHFTLQILRGLQAAHAAGIIHRDMKPSNCFVVKHEGESDFVRILDFGISKVQQPGSASLTQTNSALGTPLYMSPEQARSPRDVDGRSDLYSGGVILYELLTGHTPFFSESGEFTEILFKLFTAEPPAVKTTRPDLDDGLALVVHRALSREPRDRFATAAEMAEALAPYADARSAALVGRIRTFQPEQALSLPPPSDLELPSSMVAFSALDARPATDVMVNRPTTDLMKGAPATAMMENAPPRVPMRSQPAVPLAPEARARPEEAGDRTHVAAAPSAPPLAHGGDGAGASTRAQEHDGPRKAAAARAADGAPREPRKAPAALIGALAVGVALVSTVAVFAVRGKPTTAPDARASSSDGTGLVERPSPKATTEPTLAPHTAPEGAPSIGPSATASAAGSSATAAVASAEPTAARPPRTSAPGSAKPPRTAPPASIDATKFGIQQ